MRTQDTVQKGVDKIQVDIYFFFPSGCAVVVVVGRGVCFYGLFLIHSRHVAEASLMVLIVGRDLV